MSDIDPKGLLAGTTPGPWRWGGSLRDIRLEAAVSMRPCVMGITIDQAFIDWADALSDNTAWELSGPSKGRHMVCVVGYDRFGAIIVNSWGKGRHAGGFLRVSWQTVTDATDRYAITAVPRLPEIQR